MRSYEVTFESVNGKVYTKPITMLVIEPDTIDPDTGVMLFTHGWGGNRFQHQDKMEFTADAFNLVCLSVEFRQSGYDFNPVTGRGSYLPYDASFYQVFDVLNGLRFYLSLDRGINRERLFTFGGSQGGHVTLLASIFAPKTFAFTYASSPVTHLTAKFQESAGRAFADHELSIRNVIEHADAIQCPVFIEHGTADESVPHDTHTEALVGRLESLKKTVKVTYYKDGDHALQPTITKLDAFKAMAPDPMRTLTTDGDDDLTAGRTVVISCGDRTLTIDWSQPAHSTELFAWT